MGCCASPPCESVHVERVLRCVRAPQVAIEDLVAKPHGPNSVAETLKQLKVRALGCALACAPVASGASPVAGKATGGAGVEAF